MFCSVIIPTFNRRKTLERTLKAVLNQSVAANAFEVIVVDDGSVDDTAEFIAAALKDHPNLTFLRHAENRGRTATRNDGIRASRGEILILLDDDNVPERGFVAAHRARHIDGGDQRLVIMGDARFAPEVIGGSNFAKYMQSRYLGCRTTRMRAGLDYQDLPARCLGTLNCSMRRSDLFAVGLLDESFRFYGGEDEYLGYCLKGSGARIVFAEDARTLHYDEVTIARYRAKLMESARMGLRILMEKCPGYVESTQLRFLMPVRLGSDGIRLIATKVAMRVVMGNLTRAILEGLAFATDQIGWLYFWPLYRALTAAWFACGYRSKGSAPLVTYGTAQNP